MTQNRDFFTPESVDEQVEQISSRQSGEAALPEPGGAPAQRETRRVQDFSANENEQDASARLVQELQTFYQADYKQNRAFLARAWRRIAAHQFAQHNDNQARSPMDSAPVLHFSPERTRKMQYPRSTEQPTGKRRLSRSLSLLAAVLVAVLLVGTLALVLTFNHGQPGSWGLGAAKATATSAPTPTPAPIGTTLFTRKSPAGIQYDSASWSPDGKRIAVSAMDQQTGNMVLHIWSATSGKDLQTIPLDTQSLSGVLWSPTGKYLVLNNLLTIVIVDSQSGTIVKTINYSQPTALTVPGTGPQPLVSKAPFGGGFGFYSVAWTPDGASLAVSVSDITTGRVELLDPLTGAVKTTIRDQARSIGLAMSFSSDGKYVAVSYPNDSTIVIWDVATQGVVSVLNGAQSDETAWQPGTHNLARSTYTSVELWDVNAHKLLQTYKGESAFAWSPDGKELAVYPLFFTSPPSESQTSKVTILDAHTGTQVGLYTSSQVVSSAEWSPTGSTIVTTEFSYELSTSSISGINSSQVVVWAA